MQQSSFDAGQENGRLKRNISIPSSYENGVDGRLKRNISIPSSYENGIVQTGP